MSQFQEKVFAACAKKEALFDESLGRYALRSMLAGAYLTMSTAVGILVRMLSQQVFQPFLVLSSPLSLPLDWSSFSYSMESWLLQT